MLNYINDTLNSFVDNSDMEKVFYGANTEKEMNSWNFFVFNRKKTYKAGTSKMELQTDYLVNIIHENYIPDGFIEKVINSLQTPNKDGIKLKLKSEDIIFNYASKKNTGMVLEIATIVFTKPSKAVRV